MKTQGEKSLLLKFWLLPALALTGGLTTGAVYANEPPVADPQPSVSTLEDTAKAITLTGSDLDEDTLGYFKEKAATIFNEALLTVRLHELGYPVVDVTWLANELAKSGASQIDWKKHWRDQLAWRLQTPP